MKNILVTGGAGFIGSNFVRYMLDKYSDYKIINVDALTYAGNLGNLQDITENKNYVFKKADIRDRGAIDEIFATFDIDIVINFAAESHVDRSIDEPEIFLTTNIIGTQVLLEVAKKYWKVNPHDKYCREYKSDVKFIQISTDEVYGELGATGYFTETTPLMPNSPYSASKASADMIVRAYHETYGIPVNITRCSNNYGPYQFPEKLIPLLINNCLNNKHLPIYGDGQQVRDWLHVTDHCSAIDMVLHKGLNGEIYNIGGNNEKTNLEIAKIIVNTLGKSKDLIKHVEDRPGHDRRYAIDNTKIATQLGWVPSYTFEQGIQETIEWYVDNKEWLDNIITGEYLKYNYANVPLMELALDNFKQVYLLPALEKFYKNDIQYPEISLIKIGPREEVFTTRIAMYLRDEMVRYEEEGFRIDCEYDKKAGGKKSSYDATPHDGMKPDIIIHKRAEDEANFLFCEVKKGDISTSDKKKVGVAITEYKYRFGLLIYCIEENGICLKWYRNNNLEGIKEGYKYNDGELVKA